MRLKTGTNSLALHDLTGFEGRCDAVYMTTDEVQSPVGLDTKATDLLRKRLHPQATFKQKNYDFIVIGGGIAGMCAAASAARLGCKVALVNDRPVLGGNNSSEVRVHLGGTIEMMPNQGLGRMIREFGHSKGGNAQPGNFYEDTKKDSFILAEKNITLYPCYRAVKVKTTGNLIQSVVIRQISTGEELCLSAPILAIVQEMVRLVIWLELIGEWGVRHKANIMSLWHQLKLIPSLWVLLFSGIQS